MGGWKTDRQPGDPGHSDEHNDVGRRLNHYAYVTDPLFGAKGDGTTNDTAAIQAALADGRTVYFPKPASYYKITAPLTVASGQTLIGDYSEIRGAGITVADEAIHVTIEGLVLSSSITLTNTTAVQIQNCFIQPMSAIPCISDTNSTQLRISDCHLERGEYGLLLTNSRAVTVENCVIQANNRGTAQTGIRAIAADMVRTLLVQSCHFENNPVAIQADATYETLLDACTLQGAGFDSLNGRMALRGCVGGSGVLVSSRVTGGQDGFIQDATNVTPAASTWTAAGSTPATIDTGSGHTQITFATGGGTYEASRALCSVGEVDEWLDVALTLKADRAGAVLVVRVLLDGDSDVRVLNWTSTTDYQTIRLQVAGSGAGYVVIHPGEALGEALVVDVGTVTA